MPKSHILFTLFFEFLHCLDFFFNVGKKLGWLTAQWGPSILFRILNARMPLTILLVFLDLIRIVAHASLWIRIRIVNNVVVRLIFL